MRFAQCNAVFAIAFCCDHPMHNLSMQNVTWLMNTGHVRTNYILSHNKSNLSCEWNVTPVTCNIIDFRR